MPNGNATSLPARSPLGPGANDYCYSLVPMPPRRRVWRFQAETDAASAPRSCCSKLDCISVRRRRKGDLRATGSWRRGRLVGTPTARAQGASVAAELPQPALASDGTVSPHWHRVPPLAPCSLPEVGPCILPLAWCLAELLLQAFWHLPMQTELHKRQRTRALARWHPSGATAT